MRGTGGDRLTPVLDLLRALHETLAQLFRDLGLRVSHRAGMIAENLKLAAVELGEPALDHDSPDRVTAEKSAHNANPQALGGGRRRRKQRHRVMRRHGSAHERPETLLQVAISPALISEKERQIEPTTLARAASAFRCST